VVVILRRPESPRELVQRIRAYQSTGGRPGQGDRSSDAPEDLRT
jgi:hypothetical protein